MSSDLGELPITTEELELLVDLDSTTELAIGVYRGFMLKNPTQIGSVLLTELFTFILIVVFVMPTSLVILRNSGNLPESPARLTQLLAILIGISLLGLGVWNFYLWKQVQNIKPLAKLMEEIDKYNRVIQALELLDQLESVSPSDSQLSNLSNRQEVLEVMRVTKEGLINALRVENIVRKNEEFLARRYELFTALESNLTALMSFEPSNTLNDYGELLNEALKIGMTVHKEVRTLRNH